MDEVNVVIQSVLPVQQSLPPQKEKGLEVQSKSEDSSFDQCDENGKYKAAKKRRKRSEKMHQKIEKKTFFLKNRKRKKSQV